MATFFSLSLSFSYNNEQSLVVLCIVTASSSSSSSTWSWSRKGGRSGFISSHDDRFDTEPTNGWMVRAGLSSTTGTAYPDPLLTIYGIATTLSRFLSSMLLYFFHLVLSGNGLRFLFFFVLNESRIRIASYVLLRKERVWSWSGLIKRLHLRF